MLVAECASFFLFTSHEGPVWQVAWAHPKFGVLLASCSYDGKVVIFKEQSLNQWTQAYVHAFHEASVNAIAWAPHEYGLALACASADGNVSVLSYGTEGWSASHFKDSSLGCNAVSWAPYHSIGSVSSETGGAIKRIVTASCDKTVKIWSLPEGHTEWTKQEMSSVPAHTDWVRDVAWAPGAGLPVNLVASCSEDKHVYIWSQSEENGPWKRELLHTFDAPVWRVSWSVTGNVLAVSSGDHKVTLWKETLDKKWMYVSRHPRGFGGPMFSHGGFMCMDLTDRFRRSTKPVRFTKARNRPPRLMRTDSSAWWLWAGFRLGVCEAVPRRHAPREWSFYFFFFCIHFSSYPCPESNGSQVSEYVWM
jgi:protein transport protein SEC13